MLAFAQSGGRPPPSRLNRCFAVGENAQINL